MKPITMHAANAFVTEHHRHHKKVRGCVFCLACWDGDKLVGVLVMGRPKARMLQDGVTCEVTRCCTDGTRNACSKLYAAGAKAARAMGWVRIFTYTLPEEGGASLRAAGWTLEDDEAGGGTWSRNGRERTDEINTQTKMRWAA